MFRIPVLNSVKAAYGKSGKAQDMSGGMLAEEAPVVVLGTSAFIQYITKFSNGYSNSCLAVTGNRITNSNNATQMTQKPIE